MREKMREAGWRLRMNRLKGDSVGDCNSDMEALWERLATVYNHLLNNNMWQPLFIGYVLFSGFFVSVAPVYIDSRALVLAPTMSRTMSPTCPHHPYQSTSSISVHITHISPHHHISSHYRLLWPYRAA